MVHFDERFLTIHWDEDTKAVWAEWKEATGGESFRRGLNVGLELVLQKKSRRWLADTKNLGAVSAEDLKWTNEEWIPSVVAAGVRSMAFIVPKKVIAKIVVKSGVSRIDENELSTGYFGTVDDARAWLRAQK